jgi:hypothetical protein
MNIFSVLGLRDEKYHNRMLAWLLDPQESHGLGSRFLADFLNLVDINHNPEAFVRIKAEYAIYAPDNLKKRRPDIYLQTDEHHIFIENKVRRTSIDDIELIDQANYIRNQNYDPVIHIFIIPSIRDISISTQAIIDENDICRVQWSTLTKILDEMLEEESVDSDVRTILEQYSIYLKEHVMQEFMGFNIDEMRQYLEFSETFDKFKRFEELAGTRIHAFLSVVGEEVQDRFAKLTGQNDWQMKIKNYAEPITWGLYLTRPKYQGWASFGVGLHYFPEEQDDKILHTAITLHVEARLVDTIRRKIEEFKARNLTTHAWDENQIGKYSEFYEDWELQWNQLENWQNTKSYLVERTIEWMIESTPILEEQIIDNDFS